MQKNLDLIQGLQEQPIHEQEDRLPKPGSSLSGRSVSKGPPTSTGSILLEKTQRFTPEIKSYDREQLDKRIAKSVSPVAAIMSKVGMAIFLIKQVIQGNRAGIRWVAASRSVTENDLSRAENYGNKAANLFTLDEICDSVEDVTASVPKFHPISHSMIKQYLVYAYPGFEEDWRKFTELQRKKMEGLSPESKEQLTKIRENIQKAFAPVQHLPSDDPIQTFLDGGRGLVMVRSSGREDTEELALAGGNESVAGVARDSGAIFKAMGRVVASYFSEKSLTQRLLAHQDITQDPFMPVFLQEMIGEDPNAVLKGDQVFCCGVGYTREMGGETPDLTFIEAAYGHNEGVVNSLIPVDTYYLYSDGMNHQVILNKPKRLVAKGTETGASDFREVKNPKDIVNKPVLSAKLQQDLRAVCKGIHDHFGRPMDIEWVYDPNKEMIYVVQARPVVRRVTTHPTITNKKWFKENGKINTGKMIVHRGGETVLLKQPQEVIQERDLDSALNRYLLLERDCKEKGIENPTKAVIVEKMGSALSHPACVFRENGIAVICSQGYDTSPLEKEDTFALLDTQRGMIGQLQDPFLSHLSYEEIKTKLMEKKVLQSGWFKHPIAASESLQDFEISEPFLKELYASLALEGYKFSKENRSLDSMIESLTSQDIEEGNAAAKDLILTLYRAVKLLEPHGRLGQSVLYMRGKTLLLNAMNIGRDFLARPDRMQRLHAAKRLEALCTQDASLRILNSDSLTAILSEEKVASTLTIPEVELSPATKGKLKEIKKPMEEEELYTCLMSYQPVKVLAFSQEVKDAWKNFTDAIVSTRSRAANRLLLRMISDFEGLEVLGEWINDQFFAEYQKERDPILLLDNLSGALSEIRDVQDKVATMKREIDVWENNVNLFEDPNNFEKTWKQFGNNFASPLILLSEDFFKNQSSYTPFQKRVFLQAIVHGVDVFDKAIKALRGSPLGDVETKTTNFRSMLLLYKCLMDVFYDAIPKEIFAKWKKNILPENQYKIRKEGEVKRMGAEDYRYMMRSQIYDAFSDISDRSEKQLLPSIGFNVQAACVNSGVAFDRAFTVVLTRWEHTLEDMFMLFHQNILAGINCHQEHLPTDRFPRSLQNKILCQKNLCIKVWAQRR